MTTMTKELSRADPTITDFVKDREKVDASTLEGSEPYEPLT